VTTVQNMTRVGMLLVFGLGCAGLGARWGGAAAPAAAPAVTAAATRLSAEDRAELRRALAEDVRRAVAALPSSGAPAKPEPAVAAAPRAAEAVVARADEPPSAAHEAAHHVLDDAIARGVWRPDDAQALRETIPELSQAEASQVLAALSRAVNTGQVQVAMHDRPIL
jgi:hypothetical protein